MFITERTQGVRPKFHDSEMSAERETYSVSWPGTQESVIKADFLPFHRTAVGLVPATILWCPHLGVTAVR